MRTAGPAHSRDRFSSADNDGVNLMAQFIWIDDLCTGSKLIDDDHRSLIEFVNAFYQCMESGESNRRVSKAMSALIAYTGEHFAREEAAMRRIQYVAALAHRVEHAKLLKQLIELRDMLDAGAGLNVPAVASYLTEWLHDHILTKDMQLAYALKHHGLAPEAQTQQQ
jgi:hemerythrin-like metal-binding protein